MTDRGANTPDSAYREVATILEGLVRDDPRPYAERASATLLTLDALLAALGNPQRRVRAVHIAGSKGKGSTALLTEAALQAAGVRTATYSSPHLQRWTERFRIDGAEVEPERLLEVLRRMQPVLSALAAAHPDRPPGFFDTATAAALLLFAEAGVDVAVIETGIGGRLDATVRVEPIATCITSIELEHVDKLGGTLAAIAAEKAGIIKPGVPVFVAELPAEAQAVVAARAAALGAPLLRLGREIGYRQRPLADGGRALEVDLEEGRLRTRLKLLGAHWGANAALAAACAQRCAGPGRLEAIAAGLASARLPGRSETLRTAPRVIADGAHTGASARLLADALAGIAASRRELLLSCSRGKDLVALLSALLPGADAVTVTCADRGRSLPAPALAAEVRQLAPQLPLRVIDDPLAAVAAAVAGLPADALLCATGSVYMAGAARQALPPAD